MGITSKWKLKWIPEYHAYQIDAVSDGESKTNLSLDGSENQENFGQA